MFETYYEFTAEPFRLTPDHRLCYEHSSYKRAKAAMGYALRQGDGFIMVTGASGTGKTTLINDLLANLSAEDILAVRMNSFQMGPEELLRMVASSFGLSVDAKHKAKLMQRIKQILIAHTKAGQRVLLVVDEAQALSSAALEELRLLSNFQEMGDPLLQIFLAGQERLEDKVRSPDNERLSQRLVATCHIEPMVKEETEAYVKHRLQTVGWKGDPQLGDAVFAAIHEFSHGIPRQINFLCGRLLLLGYVLEKHALDFGDVQHTIADLQKERLVPFALGSDAGVEPDRNGALKTMHKVPRNQSASPTDRPDLSGIPAGERRNKGVKRRVKVLMGFLTVALLFGVSMTLNEHVVKHLPSWPQAERLVARIFGIPVDSSAVHDKERSIEEMETSSKTTEQTLALTEHESLKGEQPETNVRVSPIEELLQGPAVSPQGDPVPQDVEVVTEQRAVGALLTDEEIFSAEVESADSRAKQEAAVQQEVTVESTQTERSWETRQPNLSHEHEDDAALQPELGSLSLGTTKHERRTPPDDATLLVGDAKRGDIQAVESSLTAGAFPDTRETGSDVTSLIVAAKEGHMEVIETLLVGKADINATDNQGKSALFWAVEKDQVDAVKLLLARGANVNVRNRLGETSLNYASWIGNLSIVRELVDGGADVNTRNKEGWSSLINAAINGHIDLVKFLLSAGADPNIRTNDGKTALMAAAWNGHSAIVQTLLGNGAAVNARSRDGRSALIYAAWNGYDDIVRVLIAGGADLKQRDNSLQTAAEIAADQGHSSLAKFIEKAATKHTSNGGNTVFQ